jgi:hypothetical protein
MIWRKIGWIRSDFFIVDLILSVFDLGLRK